MAHFISGIIGPFQQLREFASGNSLHSPTRLRGTLGFLPLSDEHLDSLFPTQGEFDKSMIYLSSTLKAALVQLSATSTIAYVETEYFGGSGTQGATVYKEGLCVFEPTTAQRGVISNALKLLGVVMAPGQADEFDTVGLGRYRDNDAWIEGRHLS